MFSAMRKGISNKLTGLSYADLHTLKGLSPVVSLLAEESPTIQAAAAYVLGTAASNNNKFQDQLMQTHPETVTLLMQVRDVHCKLA